MDVRGFRNVGTQALALTVVGLAVLPGCVSLEGKTGKADAPPPVGTAHQLQALWQRRIVTAADVVHKGAQLPGLAGRVYLLGEDLRHSVKGKGKLLVDLYDSDHRGPDGRPSLLEHYEFPEQVLNQFLKKDGWLGWGYTIFLPWPEYRPEIEHVHVQACFIPENGTPVFASPAHMTIRGDGAPALAARTVPVSSQAGGQPGNTIPMRVPVANAADDH